MASLDMYVRILTERIETLERLRKAYKIGSLSYKFYGKKIKVLKSTVKSVKKMIELGY